MTAEELRARLAELDRELDALLHDPHGKVRTVTAGSADEARFDHLMAEREQVAADIGRHEKIAAAASNPAAVASSLTSAHPLKRTSRHRSRGVSSVPTARTRQRPLLAMFGRPRKPERRR